MNVNKNHTSYFRDTWHDQKGNINEIPGNLSLAEMQKIVLNRTAHIPRRTFSL